MIGPVPLLPRPTRGPHLRGYGHRTAPVMSDKRPPKRERMREFICEHCGELQANRLPYRLCFGTVMSYRYVIVCGKCWSKPVPPPIAPLVADVLA